jgi:catechol 2,3-dioxygenase-like lactoylglutathione lyase family enzyme
MATVRYIVDDVEAAIAFYTEALGFSVRQQFGGAMAILARDDLTLWVAGPLASASKALPDGRRPGSGGWNRFVLEVADLPTLSAELRGRGVILRSDVIEGPGGRQLLCEDPSGNPIELFEARRRTLT